MLITWSAINSLDQGLADNLLNNYFSSVPDVVPGHDHRWVCLEGGSEIITDAMQKAISVTPKLNSRVITIAIDRTVSVDNLGMLVQVKSENAPRKYSTVFNTTTLACAQRMDLRGADLSNTQKEALRSLKYDCSCKIGIRFKTNWWAKSGIIGGAAATDLPIRVCVYPSYNIEDDWDQPAVLLCSYTWSQDAQRIALLIGPDGQGKTDELLELCVKNLALLHSNIIDEESIREQVLEYYAYDWNADPNMSGSVAMFAPGQFRRLYPSLLQPCANGNLHFVGEGNLKDYSCKKGSEANPGCSNEYGPRLGCWVVEFSMEGSLQLIAEVQRARG
jgi:monoamine oxidase